MGSDLQTLQSLRPGSALEDFLDRTVIHEQAGSRMPLRAVVWGLVGAALTLGIGIAGLVLTSESPSPTSGLVGVLHALFILFICLGGLLVITGTALSAATDAHSRELMRAQLVAGSIAPGLVVAIIVLDVLAGIAALWLLGAMLWAAIDS